MGQYVTVIVVVVAVVGHTVIVQHLIPALITNDNEECSMLVLNPVLDESVNSRVYYFFDH